MLKTNLLHSWLWCANSSQLLLTNGRNRVYTFLSEQGDLVNHGIFVQARLVAAALTTSFQSRNELLFTGAVVDNIQENIVIEGVQEELELEDGPPLKQELLVTPPTKRSKAKRHYYLQEGCGVDQVVWA